MNDLIIWLRTHREPVGSYCPVCNNNDFLEGRDHLPWKIRLQRRPGVVFTSSAFSFSFYIDQFLICACVVVVVVVYIFCLFCGFVYLKLNWRSRRLIRKNCRWKLLMVQHTATLSVNALVRCTFGCWYSLFWEVFLSNFSLLFFPKREGTQTHTCGC